MDDSVVRRELVWLVSQIRSKVRNLEATGFCPTCNGIGIVNWFKRCTCVQGFKNQNLLDAAINGGLLDWSGETALSDLESLRIRAMNLALTFPIKARPKVTDRVKWPLRPVKRRS